MVNSKTFPDTSRRFCDTEVVMALTEQYDGHMFGIGFPELRSLQLLLRNRCALTFGFRSGVIINSC